MSFVQLIPVLLSFLLIGAHFLREGYLLVVALCIAIPFVLLVKRPWVARGVQVLLVLAAGEWIWTTVELIRSRIDLGQSFTLLTVIMGAVTLVTLGSALVFQTRTLRRRYGLAREQSA